MNDRNERKLFVYTGEFFGVEKIPSVDTLKTVAKITIELPNNIEPMETFFEILFCPHCNNKRHDKEIFQALRAAAGNHFFRCDACEKIFGVVVNKPVIFTAYKIGV